MSGIETESKLHLKFVTNKENTRVLFAEAGSDFTDILLSFLILPLGTVVKLLKKHYGEKAPNIGSLSTLYDGVANLDSSHFLNNDAKNLLLDPTGLNEYEWPRFIGVKNGLSFTKNATSFIITDDLRVMPNVEGSIMYTLSNLSIPMTDLDGAMTFNVAFGYNEILALLGASLISRNPLSVLLLGGKTDSASGQGSASINEISKKAICCNSRKMVLKVMTQKSTNKLLFAQANDDFINFLFGLLMICLGRVEWYLHSNSGVEVIDNLHKSVANNLCTNQFFTSRTKDMLLKPALCSNYTSSDEFTPLNFSHNMNQGHVRGSRMYMVGDDLTVAPLGITSCLSVINELGISLNDVKEVEVQVGLEEGLSILKAALTSTTALTNGLMIKPILKKEPKQEHY